MFNNNYSGIISIYPQINANFSLMHANKSNDNQQYKGMGLKETGTVFKNLSSLLRCGLHANSASG